MDGHAIEALRGAILGDVFTPADVDYDTQRNEPIVRLKLKSGSATQRF